MRRQVIAGIMGSLAGAVAFGLLIVAPLHVIKTVILIGCVVLGVLLCGGMAALLAGRR